MKATLSFIFLFLTIPLVSQDNTKRSGLYPSSTPIQYNPLWIVDGVALADSLAYKDINDTIAIVKHAENMGIKKITEIHILRDGISSALYGSRGAKGVVIINTDKKEKE